MGAERSLYLVKFGGKEKWKKSKYLGSLLDTEEDIKRRKVLATDAYKQLRHIFEGKKTNLKPHSEHFHVQP